MPDKPKVILEVGPKQELDAGGIRVVLSEFLPDNTMVVGKKMFEDMKKAAKGE